MFFFCGFSSCCYLADPPFPFCYRLAIFLRLLVLVFMPSWELSVCKLCFFGGAQKEKREGINQIYFIPLILKLS